MKRLLISTATFLCIFISYFPSLAQKQLLKDNGNNTYTMSNVWESSDNQSKIGIGIINPTAKLHLSSSPNILTSLTIDALDVGYIPNIIGSIENWKIYGTTLYGIFQTQGNNSRVIANYLKNNLGIDVLNPKNKLDVNGIIGCTGLAANGILIDNFSTSNPPFIFRYVYHTTGNQNEEDTQGMSEPPEEAGDDTISPLTIYSGGVKVQPNLECASFLTTRHLQVKYNPFVGGVYMCNDTLGNGKWTNSSEFSITDGRVGIGIINTYTNYKLAVNGKAICEEMKIKLQNNWPDYVFNDNYQLRTLSEVDQFIQTNKHLPDMPSALEVQENGINVGEMNARLVKKVEELTLYLISLQKEIEQLKAKITSR